MPACAVLGCNARPELGFSLRKIPKDPERRKEWTSLLMRKDGWKPAKNSFVCELHFKPCMWEKPREDGKRKLKADAIPTIFNFAKTKPRSKPRMIKNPLVATASEEVEVTPEITDFCFKERSTLKEVICTPPELNIPLVVATMENTVVTPQISDISLEKSKTLKEVQNALSDNDNISPIASDNITSKFTTTKENFEILQELQVKSLSDSVPSTSTSKSDTSTSMEIKLTGTKSIDTKPRTIRRLKKKKNPLTNLETYKSMLLKNEKLELEVKNLEMQLMDNKINFKHLKKRFNCVLKENAESKTMLKSIFNDDQILAMKSYVYGVRWSNATIKKALKLRSSCGINGYKELLKHKFPLPSLKTLNLKRKNPKFSSEILDGVLKTSNLKDGPNAKKMKFRMVDGNSSEDPIHQVNSLQIQCLPGNSNEADVTNTFSPVSPLELYIEHNYSLRKMDENIMDLRIHLEHDYGVAEKRQTYSPPYKDIDKSQELPEPKESHQEKRLRLQ